MPHLSRRWQRLSLALASLLLIAAVSASSVFSVAAQPERSGITVHGRLTLVNGDPAPGSDLPQRARWGVRTDAGELVWLAGQPHIDPTLRNALVTLTGVAGPGETLFPTSIDFDAPTAAALPEFAPSTGVVNWVNLLCRFADVPDEPHTPQWITERFGTTAPQMTHYFNAVSYGALQLAPTDSYGWFTLPKPRSAYVVSDDFGEWFNQVAALEDCTAVADAQVDFSEYDGFNMLFNGQLDGYAYGGEWSLTLDGINNSWGVTWLPPFGYETHSVLAHEMGHAMGLQHSTGTYGQSYESMWDLMSNGGTCYPANQEWTCVGVHPIAYYTFLMGWLAQARVTTVASNESRLVTLAPLSEIASPGQLLAMIPINGSPTQFLTVEARVKTGYDQGVPLEGVIIHRVDLIDWTDPARILDADQDGDPNDEGAVWVVGETFVDAGSGISVAVTGRDGLSFTVEITSNTAFNRTWDRTDRPVAAGAASRTWMWGPEPIASPLSEEYWDAPGGSRTVVYWDKSRMEITDPAADPTSVWYVTNGLLARELITGQLQLADDWFEPYAPSTSNVAGDPDDVTGPTYQTFGALLNSTPAADGATLSQRVSRAGVISTDASLSAYGATAAHRVTVPGLDHQVASPFWDFMNTSGVVYENGQFVTDTLFIDPFYATGLPITEAYWATVQVGGQATDVLMQCFERRCLTWTPDNPTGWQVEAGNVGSHYYGWRQLVTADDD